MAPPKYTPPEKVSFKRMMNSIPKEEDVNPWWGGAGVLAESAMGVVQAFDAAGDAAEERRRGMTSQAEAVDAVRQLKSHAIGAAKTAGSFVRGLGQAAVGGIESAGRAVLAGPSSFDEFVGKFTAEFEEFQKKTSLDVLSPETPEDNAWASVLGLVFSPIEAVGETAFGTTESPAAGALAQVGAVALWGRRGLRAAAARGAKKPPPKEPPFGSVPLSGELMPRGPGGPVATVPPPKVRAAFDGVAVKNPAAALSIAAAVARVDPAKGKMLEARAKQIEKASPKELSEVGRDIAKAEMEVASKPVGQSKPVAEAAQHPLREVIDTFSRRPPDRLPARSEQLGVRAKVVDPRKIAEGQIGLKGGKQGRTLEELKSSGVPRGQWKTQFGVSWEELNGIVPGVKVVLDAAADKFVANIITQDGRFLRVMKDTKAEAEAAGKELFARPPPSPPGADKGVVHRDDIAFYDLPTHTYQRTSPKENAPGPVPEVLAGGSSLANAVELKEVAEGQTTKSAELNRLRKRNKSPTGVPPRTMPKRKPGESMLSYLDRALKEQAVRELEPTPPGEDPFKPSAREEDSWEARGDINKQRTLKIFGAAMYGMKDMPRIVTKEMLQNSFDSVKKTMQVENLKGRVSVRVNPLTRTISFLDNGRGMSREVLTGPFLKVAESYKETGDSGGGFGIAKMVFVYGNTGLRVITMQGGKVHELVTTGEEAAASMEATGAALKGITREPTAQDWASFPEGHGTLVEVKIPEKYTNSSTGEVEEIEFNEHAVEYPLSRSPLFRDIEVLFFYGENPKGWTSTRLDTVDIGANFPHQDYIPFVDVQFAWGNASIYVSKPGKLAYVGTDNTIVLSNGVFQFHATTRKLGTYNLLPRQMYIDIHPSVLADSPHYPFAPNRMSFSPSAKDDFALLQQHLQAVFSFAESADLSQKFGTAQYLTQTKTGLPQLSAAEELIARDSRPRTVFDTLAEGDQVSIDKGKIVVNGKELPPIDFQELAKQIPNRDTLMIPQNKLHSDRPMVHDNALIEENGVEMPLAEYMNKHHPIAFLDYLGHVTDAFAYLRNAFEKVMPTGDIPTNVYGVTLTPEAGYYGVSIRLPFKGEFVNPLTTIEKVNPGIAARELWGSMLHELTHAVERSHSSAYAIAYETVLSRIEGLPGYLQRKEKFVQEFVDRHTPIWEAGREVYKSGNLKPRATQFTEDSARSKKPDGGSNRRDESLREASEGDGAEASSTRGAELAAGAVEGRSAAGEGVDPAAAERAAEGLSNASIEVEAAMDVPPAGAPGEPGYVDLNMGIPIKLSDLQAAFDMVRKVPGVDAAVGKMAEYWDATLRSLAPEARSKEASLSGAIIAGAIAKQKIQQHIAHGPPSAKRESYWNMHPGQQEAFIDGLESGKDFLDPVMQSAKRAYNAWNNRLSDIEKGRGITYQMEEHYLYHVYEDGMQAAGTLNRNLGKAWTEPGFTKDRVFHDYATARKHGAKPKFTNPEHIMQARQHAHDIAIAKLDMLEELARFGLAIPVKGKETMPPAGFAANSRRAPTGQRYWVHLSSDAILHNFYDQKGLWTLGQAADAGIGAKVGGAAFRGGMFVKNSVVPVILSASGFHGIHVLTIDNVTGALRAMKEWAGGSKSGQRAIGDALWSLMFLDIVKNPMEGGRISRILKGKIPEKDWTESDRWALSVMMEGGFVPLQPHVYKTNALEQFRSSIEKAIGWGREGEALKAAGQAPKAAFYLPFAIVQAMQKPMFDVWIPNLKAASYLKDVSAALKADPSLLQDPARRKETFRALAKSVDNRYGEMAYDTLYWDKWMKDTGVFMTLSLGWNLGFVREFGGGALQAGRLIAGGSGGGKLPPAGGVPLPGGGMMLPKGGLPKGSPAGIRAGIAQGKYDKLIYGTFYIVTGALLFGALLNKLLSGDNPEELLDYTNPRTGEIDAEGNPVRLNTMHYNREFVAIAKHIEQEGVATGMWHLISSKAAPTLELIKGWATGVDSLGREIRNPESPAFQQLQQSVAWTLSGMEPISVESLKRGVVPDKGVSTALALGGFSPAAKYITLPPTEAKIRAKFMKYYGQKRTPFERAQQSEAAAEAKALYRNRRTREALEVMQKMRKEFELSSRDYKRLKDSVVSPEDPYGKMFSRLDWRIQRELLDDMSPRDRFKYIKFSNKEHLRYKYRPPKESK